MAAEHVSAYVLLRTIKFPSHHLPLASRSLDSAASVAFC